MGTIIKKRQQSILILDLDGVAFAGEPDVDSIDTEHHVLGDLIDLKGGSKGVFFKVAFINPSKLRRLIEYACRAQGGVLFMTAGFWDEVSVKQNFVNYLNLSTTTAEKISKAPFLNANKAQAYFPDLPLFKIPDVTKNLWLHHFLEEHPEFRNKNFVVLDDNPKQIRSFAGVKQVVPILATTHKHQTSTGIKPQSFYNQTLHALRGTHSSNTLESDVSPNLLQKKARHGLNHSKHGIRLKQLFSFFVPAKPHTPSNKKPSSCYKAPLC